MMIERPPHATSGAPKPKNFMICGLRPVFSAETADGGLAVYAYQWQSGQFALDMSYLTRICGWPNAEDDEVDQIEFNAAVAKLRADLHHPKG